MGATLLRQRCDPYGRESKIQLMGGLFPERRASKTALEIGFCPRPAEGIYRMVCACGHKGQRMPLCGPGIVADARGKNYPHPGHVASIQRRQAGLCPPCAFPPIARELAEVAEAKMTDLQNANRLGMQGAALIIINALEACQAQLDELVTRGIIHRCPLKLVEVS
jgi:hypothetical protein